MAKKKQSRAANSQKASEKRSKPRSLAIAENGINTAQQFSALMSALMSDLLDSSITPGIANATCNAGGKLLKMVELNQKYGMPLADGKKNLELVAALPAPAATNQ